MRTASTLEPAPAKVHRKWVIVIYGESKSSAEARKEAEAEDHFVLTTQPYDAKFKYDKWEGHSWLDRLGCDEFYFCL